MVQILVIGLAQNIYEVANPFDLRELYVIALSTLSTCCIKVAVHSIRYFNWR